MNYSVLLIIYCNMMRGETLRMWYNKFFNYMKRRKTNAILSLLSKGNISFGIFKDIAEISDTIKFESINTWYGVFAQ